MKTELELLELLLECVDTDYTHYGICSNVYKLCEDRRITPDDAELLLTIIQSEKPSIVLNSEFFYHELWRGSMYWWSPMQEVGPTPERQVRIDFLKHLIKKYEDK